MPSETFQTLTVRDLTRTLQQRGIEISYKTVSDFLGTDDISSILGISGDRNARQIPPDVADILVEFLPQYRANKGRLPQAAAMLRSFLQVRNHADDADATAVEPNSSTSQLLPLERFSSTPQPLTTQTLVAAIVAGVQAALPSNLPDDTLLTRAQAAEMLACQPEQVSRYVKGIASRRGVWRKRDVLEYIAKQTQKK